MNPVAPTPEHATAAPEKITMYGADWCGDCLRAKAFFDAHDVEYDFVDLVEHAGGNDVVLTRNGGVQKIPVIIFPDNSHLTEPTTPELEAKMAQLKADTDTDTDTDESTPGTYTINENRDEGRFELHHDGQILSVADFSERSGGVVVVPHVATDPQHRGLGNAGRLMDGVLDILRASDRKIVPICPFAANHLRENPDQQDLLA